MACLSVACLCAAWSAAHARQRADDAVLQPRARVVHAGADRSTQCSRACSSLRPCSALRPPPPFDQTFGSQESWPARVELAVHRRQAANGPPRHRERGTFVLAPFGHSSSGLRSKAHTPTLWVAMWETRQRASSWPTCATCTRSSVRAHAGSPDARPADLLACKLAPKTKSRWVARPSDGAPHGRRSMTPQKHPHGERCSGPRTARSPLRAHAGSPDARRTDPVAYELAPSTQNRAWPSQGCLVVKPSPFAAGIPHHRQPFDSPDRGTYRASSSFSSLLVPFPPPSLHATLGRSEIAPI